MILISPPALISCLTQALQGWLEGGRQLQLLIQPLTPSAAFKSWPRRSSGSPSTSTNEEWGIAKQPGVQLTWSLLAISRCRLPFPKCENPTPQPLNSESTGPWMGLWPRAPQLQSLPRSQSLGTMHFARRFQSTPWVTGAEACWHLSPLRSGREGN